MAAVEEGVIDLIQLHGDEDTAYIAALKEKTTLPLIRAVRLKSAEDALNAQKLPVDHLLLDAYKKGVYGGTGTVGNWEAIPELNKPFFLAGGLDCNNLDEAMAYQPYCLDVSSGAETEGEKDPQKIKELVTLVRRCEK